ncbi:GTPase [Egicoccus sp. AB-alg2]|uniref:GTPase n=1 Tax=Egicoccus sp. AB-alg2 TaxID=3242693 RepID=UPI00359E81C9
MTGPRRTRGRRRPAGSGPGEVADALDTVVALGPGRVDEPTVTDAVALRRRLDERLARGEGLTVAALAGGTGVGKSALVNALLGHTVTAEGVRRPTTATTLAAVRTHTPETIALLDWLEVPARAEVGDDLPDGLVLLDLPDHDSVVEDHRRTAARLAGRVDVVAWVVDPVKYARDDAHGGPLASLTAHADVLLVVLNRVDELRPEDVEVCRADLRERLAAGGHPEARVLTTSARTGDGVDALRDALHDIAARRTAATARLVADAHVLGRRAAARLDAAPQADPQVDDLLDEVLVAVDGHRAAAEAAGLYRREAARRMRSPLGRAVRAPVRAVTGGWIGRTTAAAAEPPPRASTVEGVETALLRALDVGATVGRTHDALDRAVRRAATQAAPALTDAVATAELVPTRRRWWSAMAGLRTVAEVVALAGLFWLIALAVIDWLRLPEPPLPYAVGEVPWPTALLLGGLLGRLLLGVVSRLSARVGARRHAGAVRRRIEQALRAAVDRDLLAPVRQELDDQRRLRDAIATLGRSG